MVRLNRIYTRGGDKGTTSLGDGRRVMKTDPRVEAYGAVDELNAHLGSARLALEEAGAKDLADRIARIQNDLFDLGADLSVPIKENEEAGSVLRIGAERVQWLESEIDALTEILPPLTSFLLPGGSRGSAALHMARTVARRAERRILALAEREGVVLNLQACVYMNRLSDYLFCAARKAAEGGEILWRPGGGERGDRG